MHSLVILASIATIILLAIAINRSMELNKQIPTGAPEKSMVQTINVTVGISIAVAVLLLLGALSYGGYGRNLYNRINAY